MRTAVPSITAARIPIIASTPIISIRVKAEFCLTDVFIIVYNFIDVTIRSEVNTLVYYEVLCQVGIQ